MKHPEILPIRDPDAYETLVVEVPGPGTLKIKIPRNNTSASHAWFTPAFASMAPATAAASAGQAHHIA
jgi:hypothetical protein